MPLNLWDSQFSDPYLSKTIDMISPIDSQTYRGSSKKKTLLFGAGMLMVRKSQKGATSNHLSLYFSLNAN